MRNQLLHPDRYFDADPTIRQIARDLYSQVKDLPIVCPHGHVDPALFSENEAFSDPTKLILIPDHYIFRMLYSQGIPMESLGVPTVDGSPIETDNRKIWQTFADNYHLYAATPTGGWLAHEFHEVFKMSEKLSSSNAMEFYDELSSKLQLSENRPRAMFERFNIEVLNTTDAAYDTLDLHKKIRASGWEGKIIPCFRPDDVLDLSFPEWRSNIEKLSVVTGIEIDSYTNYIKALEDRRAFFKQVGAVSTDHAVIQPYTAELSAGEADRILQKALMGKSTSEDAKGFMAHMLIEMARMSIEDGLTMQLHAGSLRNYNTLVFNRFGRDKGCDIPVRTEYTHNLHALLNKYGNDTDLTLVVFTLDESTYSRELAPLAGHFPAMKLGPPWWFHDSIQGMTRFREQVTETAGIYNTVGFNDDTRAFPSIPARHDVSRRVDSNFLARMVAEHLIDMEDASRMSKALARDLVKGAYNL